MKFDVQVFEACCSAACTPDVLANLLPQLTCLAADADAANSSRGRSTRSKTSGSKVPAHLKTSMLERLVTDMLTVLAKTTAQRACLEDQEPAVVLALPASSVPQAVDACTHVIIVAFNVLNVLLAGPKTGSAAKRAVTTPASIATCKVIFANSLKCPDVAAGAWTLAIELASMAPGDVAASGLLRVAIDACSVLVSRATDPAASLAAVPAVSACCRLVRSVSRSTKLTADVLDAFVGVVSHVLSSAQFAGRDVAAIVLQCMSDPYSFDLSMLSPLCYIRLVAALVRFLQTSFGEGQQPLPNTVRDALMVCSQAVSVAPFAGLAFVYLDGFRLCSRLLNHCSPETWRPLASLVVAITREVCRLVSVTGAPTSSGDARKSPSKQVAKAAELSKAAQSSIVLVTDTLQTLEQPVLEDSLPSLLQSGVRLLLHMYARTFASCVACSNHHNSATTTFSELKVNLRVLKDALPVSLLPMASCFSSEDVHVMAHVLTFLMQQYLPCCPSYVSTLEPTTVATSSPFRKRRAIGATTISSHPTPAVDAPVRPWCSFPPFPSVLPVPAVSGASTVLEDVINLAQDGRDIKCSLGSCLSPVAPVVGPRRLTLDSVSVLLVEVLDFLGSSVATPSLIPGAPSLASTELLTILDSWGVLHAVCRLAGFPFRGDASKSVEPGVDNRYMLPELCTVARNFVQAVYTSNAQPLLVSTPHAPSPWLAVVSQLTAAAATSSRGDMTCAAEAFWRSICSDGDGMVTWYTWRSARTSAALLAYLRAPHGPQTLFSAVASVCPTEARCQLGFRRVSQLLEGDLSQHLASTFLDLFSASDTSVDVRRPDLLPAPLVGPDNTRGKATPTHMAPPVTSASSVLSRHERVLRHVMGFSDSGDDMDGENEENDRCLGCSDSDCDCDSCTSGDHDDACGHEHHHGEALAYGGNVGDFFRSFPYLRDPFAMPDSRQRLPSLTRNPVGVDGLLSSVPVQLHVHPQVTLASSFETLLTPALLKKHLRSSSMPNRSTLEPSAMVGSVDVHLVAQMAQFSFSVLRDMRALGTMLLSYPPYVEACKGLVGRRIGITNGVMPSQFRAERKLASRPSLGSITAFDVETGCHSVLLDGSTDVKLFVLALSQYVLFPVYSQPPLRPLFEGGAHRNQAVEDYMRQAVQSSRVSMIESVLMSRGYREREERSAVPGPPPPPRASATTPWNCPSCTLLNEPSARMCGVCGTGAPGVEGQPPSNETRTEPAPPGMWACNVCTFHNRYGNGVCEACGMGRAPALEQHPPDDVPTPSRRRAEKHRGSKDATPIMRPVLRFVEDGTESGGMGGFPRYLPAPPSVPGPLSRSDAVVMDDDMSGLHAMLEVFGDADMPVSLRRRLEERAAACFGSGNLQREEPPRVERLQFSGGFRVTRLCPAFELVERVHDGIGLPPRQVHINDMRLVFESPEAATNGGVSSSSDLVVPRVRLLYRLKTTQGPATLHVGPTIVSVDSDTSEKESTASKKKRSRASSGGRSKKRHTAEGEAFESTENHASSFQDDGWIAFDDSLSVYEAIAFLRSSLDQQAEEAPGRGIPAPFRDDPWNKVGSCMGAGRRIEIEILPVLCWDTCDASGVGRVDDSYARVSVRLSKPAPRPDTDAAAALAVLSLLGRHGEEAGFSACISGLPAHMRGVGEGPGRVRPFPRDFTALNSTAVLQAVEQQLADALMGVMGPPSLLDLVTRCVHLIPLSTRRVALRVLGFGPSRCLAEIQDMDRMYSSLRREDGPIVGSDAVADASARVAYRHSLSQAAGRLARDRVTVRRDALDDDAPALMRLHCKGLTNRVTLEVQFEGDQGSGVGVTREFFAKAAELLIAKHRGLWHEGSTHSETALLSHPRGLFPRPGVPPSTAVQWFEFLGRMIGVALQDRRVVPLDISPLFFEALQFSIAKDVGSVTEAMQERFDKSAVAALRNPLWPLPVSPFEADVLLAYYPAARHLLAAAQCQAQARASCVAPATSSMDTIAAMCLEFLEPVSGKSLSQYAPIDVVTTGGVTQHNVDVYLTALAAFASSDGVAEAVESFKHGVCEVVEPRCLLLFTPSELKDLACGRTTVQWAHGELTSALKCTNGYSASSRTIALLIQVLVDFTPAERAAFLQFVTGCPALPPGGLTALDPPLNIIPKDAPGPVDLALPSTSTCFHQLKLPAYTTKDVLKERLLTAMITRHWCRHCLTATNVTERDLECPSCGASLDRARSSDVEALVRSMQAAAEGATGGASSHAHPTGSISMEGLISMLQRTMAGGGGLGGVGIGRDDAVRDEDMEGVLQRLMDQFSGSHGAPPASAAVVAALPTWTLSGEKPLPIEVDFRVEGISGEVVTVPAGFGPSVPLEGLTGVLIAPKSVTGHPAVVAPAGTAPGWVALLDRGVCSFSDKIRRSAAAGAVAVIVIQNSDVWPYTMTDSATNGEGCTIPAVMIRQDHGLRIRQFLAQQGTSPVRCSLKRKPPTTTCTICQDSYDDDKVVTQMPCQHVYHKACIEGWLSHRNNCPVCRMELPTDDKDYEERRAARRGGDADIVNSWYT